MSDLNELQVATIKGVLDAGWTPSREQGYFLLGMLAEKEAEVERLNSDGGLGKSWSLNNVERLERERDAALAEVAALRERMGAVEEFMSTVHGMNEMSVVRGYRRVLAGEVTNFSTEVHISVYGYDPEHDCARCDAGRWPSLIALREERRAALGEGGGE